MNSLDMFAIFIMLAKGNFGLNTLKIDLCRYFNTGGGKIRTVHIVQLLAANCVNCNKLGLVTLADHTQVLRNVISQAWWLRPIFLALGRVCLHVQGQPGLHMNNKIAWTIR